jgi:hypothetical protein
MDQDTTPDNILYWLATENNNKTRAIPLKDINVSTIKGIAAAALVNPNPNTDAGHAFKRRYGTAEMLTYLATMPPEASISFTRTTTGLYFPDPKTEPWKATAKTLRDKQEEQSFLKKHANEMAFVTQRIVGKTPLMNVTLFLPSWVIGVNQVTSAGPSEIEKEIYTIIGEQGWVVALVAMAASGMEEKDILKHFQQFEKEFEKPMPKRGWFNDNTGRNQLPRIIDMIPKYTGFRLDYETLEQIGTTIDSIYQKLPDKFLPAHSLQDLRQEAPIVINKGDLVFVLPSEHEYFIREAVALGHRKEKIHQSPKSEGGKGKFIDRFVTVYPVIEKVNFYPFTPFKYREPDH